MKRLTICLLTLLMAVCSAYAEPATTELKPLGTGAIYTEGDLETRGPLFSYTENGLPVAIVLMLPRERATKADGGGIIDVDIDDQDDCQDPTDYSCYTTGAYTEPHYDRNASGSTGSTTRCAQYRHWEQAPVNPICLKSCPDRRTVVASKDVQSAGFAAYIQGGSMTVRRGCEDVMLRCPYGDLPRCPPLGW